MPKILVIDDDQEVLNIIELAFTKSSSVSAICISDPNKASNILEKEDIKVIVTDLMMPSIDGFQLIEKFKSDSKYKTIPILVLSILSSHKEKMRCLLLGVSGYINKPFNPIELRTKVEEFIFSVPRRL